METSDILLLGLFAAGGFALYEFMNSQSAAATSTGTTPPASGVAPPPTDPNYYDPGYGQQNTPYYSGTPNYPVSPPYTGSTSGTLGMRNNNPGNLRPGGHEAHYSSMRAGITAAMNNLIAYRNQHGLSTVAGIISRWAPPSENDTQAYINFVAERLGVSSTQTINVMDPATMYNLLMAIFYYENAGQTPDAATVQSVVSGKLGGANTIMKITPPGWGPAQYS